MKMKMEMSFVAFSFGMCFLDFSSG